MNGTTRCGPGLSALRNLPSRSTRATCCCRIDACETERAQVEFIDKDIDHSHRVFIGDVVIQALWQQCDLRPSLTFDEPLHDCPRHDHDGQKVRQLRAFSHSLDPKRSVTVYLLRLESD